MQIHYLGRLDDGAVFVDSTTAGPLELIIGDGDETSQFGALATGVIGMEVGETRSIALEPEQAFGPHRSELVRRVRRGLFRTDQVLEIGTVLRTRSHNHDIEYRVTEVAPEAVTLDANHSLAGRAVTFEIKLMEIY